MEKINIGLSISAKKEDEFGYYECDNCPFFKDGKSDPEERDWCFFFKESMQSGYVCPACRTFIDSYNQRNETICSECGGTGDMHYILCPTTKDW